MENVYTSGLELTVLNMLLQGSKTTKQIIETLPDQDFINVKEFNLAMANLRRNKLVSHPLGIKYVITLDGRIHLKNIEHAK